LLSPFKLLCPESARFWKAEFCLTKSGNSQQEVVNVRNARRIKLSAVVINFVMTRLLAKGVLAYKIIVIQREAFFQRRPHAQKGDSSYAFHLIHTSPHALLDPSHT
jgi:hypothetical protein